MRVVFYGNKIQNEFVMQESAENFLALLTS